MLEHKRPRLVRDRDVEQTIAVDVGDFEGRADAAVLVDGVLHPDGGPVLPPQFEPVTHRRFFAAGTAPSVRPPALAGHEVGQTIPVDVGWRKLGIELSVKPTAPQGVAVAFR
jgi:hypothetical protein